MSLNLDIWVESLVAMSKLHDKLKSALLPFAGAEDCSENRDKIIKLVLNILPTASRVDAEVVAVGLLGELEIEQAKEKAQKVRSGECDQKGGDPERDAS